MNEEKNVDIFNHPIIEGIIAASIGLSLAAGIGILIFK